MTREKIKQLPTDEKIRIMEVIWEDLRERFEHSEISPAQAALLDDRRNRTYRGEARTLEWDQVKGSIGRP